MSLSESARPRANEPNRPAWSGEICHPSISAPIRWMISTLTLASASMYGAATWSRFRL